MSYRSLLAHRVDIYANKQVIVDGIEAYDWSKVASNVPCRVDLQFIRKGVDPQWTPEAGRNTDRTGVGFFLAGAKVRTGYRMVVKKGPPGVFLIDGSVDEVQGHRGKTHHLEVGLTEVPGPIAASMVTDPAFS